MATSPTTCSARPPTPSTGPRQKMSRRCPADQRDRTRTNVNERARKCRKINERARTDPCKEQEINRERFAFELAEVGRCDRPRGCSCHWVGGSSSRSRAQQVLQIFEPRTPYGLVVPDG